MTNASHPERTVGSIASQLIGVWELLAYSEERKSHEDVHPFGPHPQGFLIYTSNGFVSAQIQKPGRLAFRSPNWHNATPQEYSESGSGYLGYSGTYEVDESTQTVIHTPTVAFPPNFLNQKLSRAITLHGDRLTLRTPATTDTNGVSFISRLDWQRV